MSICTGSKINPQAFDRAIHFWRSLTRIYKMSFKHLHRRAFSPLEGRLALQGDGRKRALAYLQRRDDFSRLLFAGIHMSSGMPARGEELRIIRWANTVAVRRNIVIHKGRIMLLFAYNKVSTTANHSFYIVRVPCPTVERALFLYLAYIRPFTDFLLRQLKLVDAETKTNLLFFSKAIIPQLALAQLTARRA